MPTVGVGASCEGVGDVGVVFEDHGGLFEGSALGLDRIEVHEDGLEAVPDGVDDVVLPVEGIEGDGVDVLVEHECGDDGQAGEERAGLATTSPKYPLRYILEEGHSLSTNLVGKDFQGVRDQDGVVGNGVEGVVQEDHGDESVGRVGVSSIDLACAWIRRNSAIGVECEGVSVGSSADGDAHVEERHAGGGNEP